jgi:hypothetical protein
MRLKNAKKLCFLELLGGDRADKGACIHSLQVHIELLQIRRFFAF